MRAAGFALVALTTNFALMAACGGSPPPSQTSATPAAAGADTSGAAAPGAAGPAPSTGPASTTTQTLGAGGLGTKLTPLTADAGADGAVKHHAELGRSVADLRAIVGSHRDEARACYDNALPAHPGIEGTIDVRWTIDPTGKVTDADIDTSHSELVEPAVANCLIAIIKNIRFNVSAKGFETKAHYPFNFHPRGRHTVNP